MQSKKPKRDFRDDIFNSVEEEDEIFVAKPEPSPATKKIDEKMLQN
jgi:hypothetical protein